MPDTPATITAYISIGNTDNKLTHAEWSDFCTALNELLVEGGKTRQVYGVWHSLPWTPYVNACWAVAISTPHIDAVKDALARIGARFRQDSIAFAVAETELLRCAA